MSDPASQDEIDSEVDGHNNAIGANCGRENVSSNDIYVCVLTASVNGSFDYVCKNRTIGGLVK